MLFDKPFVTEPIRNLMAKGIDSRFAIVLLYDELPEDHLNKIPFDLLLEACQRAPRNSEVKNHILNRLWSLVKNKNFEERLEVYRQSDPESELEEFILKDLWNSAKTSRERIEVCNRTKPGSELEKITVEYVAGLEAPFELWLEVYEKSRRGKIRDKAFEKMRECAKRLL